MNVGVLALQGDFAAHARGLARAGAEARLVRHADELAAQDALILPGGESTAMLHALVRDGLEPALRAFLASGKPVLGTCAGAILLAREVRPRQPSLGLLDAVIERNAFGRQVDSFEARVVSPALGGPVDAVFIRAPRFRALFPDVEVLGRHEGEPVLVRQGRVVAATFHPELTTSRALHRYLAGLAGTRELAPASASPRTARPRAPQPSTID